MTGKSFEPLATRAEAYVWMPSTWYPPGEETIVPIVVPVPSPQSMRQRSPADAVGVGIGERGDGPTKRLGLDCAQARALKVRGWRARADVEGDTLGQGDSRPGEVHAAQPVGHVVVGRAGRDERRVDLVGTQLGERDGAAATEERVVLITLLHQVVEESGLADAELGNAEILVGEVDVEDKVVALERIVEGGGSVGQVEHRQGGALGCVGDDAGEIHDVGWTVIVLSPDRPSSEICGEAGDAECLRAAGQFGDERRLGVAADEGVGASRSRRVTRWSCPERSPGTSRRRCCRR